MNRTLLYLNTFGVIALTILCVFQWKANRDANLAVNRLEKIRLEQSAEIDELSRKLKGTSEDLETFRNQIARTTGKFNEADQKLAGAERELEQLKVQNDQLKTSLTNWVDAVASRDSRIKEANTRIQELSQQLNSNAITYNKLATNYNTVVSQLDALRAATSQAQKPSQ